MSPIASPPPAIRTATSARTRPVVSRSWVGVNPFRTIVPDRASVTPAWSDSIRVATFPAWATTPVPSADTTNP